MTKLHSRLAAFFTLAVFSVFCPLLVSAEGANEEKRAECVCPEKPALKQALADASLVFVGRVSGIKKSVLKAGQLEVTFSVSKHYKGLDELGIDFQEPDSKSDEMPKDVQVVVYTAEDSDPCSYPFYESHDYLVFASGSPAHMKTDQCSQTTLLDNALKMVRELDDLKSPKEKSSEPKVLKRLE